MKPDASLYFISPQTVSPVYIDTPLNMPKETQTVETHLLSHIKVHILHDMDYFSLYYKLRWNVDMQPHEVSKSFKCDLLVSDSKPEEMIIQTLVDTVRKEFDYSDYVLNHFFKVLQNIVITPSPTDFETNHVQDIAAEAAELPGVFSQVAYPCDCKFNANDSISSIYKIVQHLNDVHMWSREKIADWLDKLMDVDGIDLTFKVVNKPEDELGWKPLGYITEEL